MSCVEHVLYVMCMMCVLGVLYKNCFGCWRERKRYCTLDQRTSIAKSICVVVCTELSGKESQSQGFADNMITQIMVCVVCNACCVWCVL